jgi:DNA-binding MarR family transcriptional regulator
MTQTRRTTCLDLANEVEQYIVRCDSDVPSWRYDDEQRVEMVASFIQGLNAIEGVELLQRFVAKVIENEDQYDTRTIVIPALQFVLDLKTGQPLAESISSVVGQLLSTAVKRLEEAIAVQPERPQDWSRAADVKCDCADCRELRAFLVDPARRVLRLAVRKDRRRHLHSQIDGAQLDLTHVTDRNGSPHTLVCTKNQASFERRLKQFAEDKRHLAELISFGMWISPEPPEPQTPRRIKRRHANNAIHSGSNKVQETTTSTQPVSNQGARGIKRTQSKDRGGTTSPQKPTARQAQFLAFILDFQKLNHGVAPSHVDFQKYFELTPPSVNSMLKRLDERGFISRVPGQARSITITIDPTLIPPLE